MSSVPIESEEVHPVNSSEAMDSDHEDSFVVLDSMPNSLEAMNDQQAVLLLPILGEEIVSNDVRNRLHELQSERDSFYLIQQSSEDEIKNLKSKLEELQLANQQLINSQLSIVTLETTLNQKVTEIEELNKLIESLKQQLEEIPFVNEQLANCRATINALKTSLQERVVEIGELQKFIDSLKQQLEEIQRANNSQLEIEQQLRQQLEDYQKTKSALEATLNERVGEIGELQASIKKYGAQNDEICALKAEIEACKSEYEAEKDRHEATKSKNKEILAG